MRGIFLLAEELLAFQEGLCFVELLSYLVFILFLVMEQQWNAIDRGKPKYSGKNLSQCHFVHHKSHMD
jgi:hypothetical protein